ncbi:MAG: antibiotic biosynthesis monooxygenase family protein [Pseudomonadota bacterium]
MRTGEVAVIFVSTRTGADAAGYAAAAEAMDLLAAAQPGYAGVDHVHDESGRAITVSYWRDEESAVQWRDHPDHAAARDAGRARWYANYQLFVARIERGYRWSAA